MRGKRQWTLAKPWFRILLTGFMIMAASTFGSGRSSSGDFAAGLAAYDAGDLQAAHDAWLILAQDGDVEAQVALAGLLASGGAGLNQDLQAAVLWYRRAAAAGDAVAQMNLGEFYARGRGVAHDRRRALAWFSLAAAQGRQWAADERDKLAALMTPVEIEAARMLADELRAAP